MDPTVENALSIFYKLKGKYDKEGDKIKHKIMNSTTDTITEKRDLYQAQKRKCVNCRKPVGTIFEINENSYVALCGATQDQGETPCDLNIKIVKGNVVQLTEYVDKLKEEHEKLITSIMRVKYNLLFKYSTEEDTITQFEKEKEEFDKNATLYDLYKTKLIQISTLLEKREKIAVNELELFEFIKEIKELVEESAQSGNSQLLRDAVEMYIKKVLEKVKIGRELKYSYQAVEEDNNSYKLIQIPYTQDETEAVVGKAYKVDSLKLKN